MAAQIESLITGPDKFEVIRDQLAAILVVESEQQQVLAAAASQNPDLWKLRVYLERSNPWSEFIDDPEQVDGTPLVNVTWTNFTPDKTSGNVVSGGRVAGTYNIDCYGYGKSADVEGGGHIPGDQAAAIEVARVVRLVRNILLSSYYAELAMPGVVCGRWLTSVTALDPPMSERAVQHVLCARLTLAVDFIETSPQVQGEPFETLSLLVKRAEDGMLLLAAQYGEDS